MQIDAAAAEEIEKLSPDEQEKVMRFIEKFYRNLGRSRRKLLTPFNGGKLRARRTRQTSPSCRCCCAES